MIFLAAGTQDGRELAQKLLASGFSVLVSVVSDYGKSLLPKDEHLLINGHVLDETALRKVLQTQGVDTFIDATHPYAVHISQTAMRVCESLRIKYIRYERSLEILPDYAKIYCVKDYEAAAQKAFSCGERVFLTTGSRHLEEFATLAQKDEKRALFARVLPVPESLDACLKAGIAPKYTIAMQGPFTEELNLAMYRQCKAQVVVLKNSGRLGGTDTKVKAAQKAGLHIVVIDRPQINYRNVFGNYQSVIDACRKK